jgi:SAM-dependent methyltransferase
MLIAVAASARAGAPDAQRIIRDSGIKGGLVVHVGCGTGELTAALRVNDRYVVHGLEVNADRVAVARRKISELERYGPISVDVFDGVHLPYVDNLVNLVLAEELGGVPMDECLRVLSPRGVAYVKAGGTWTRTVKPVPPGIDEWPHYLHGADNNAVARDTVVGPPRRMQWVGGPTFARSHEINSSMAAMVSAGGRLFYIWDEGPTGMTDKRLPAMWSLIARDAWGGVVLWKRPMPEWGWREWNAPARWNNVRERAKMLRHLPSTLPRRVVASGERVYVTLGYHAPVTALDAATGEAIDELAGTALTDEILHLDGALILRVREPDSPPERDVWGTIPNPARARVTVVEAHAGRVRWQSKPDKMAPLSLAARDGRVFYSDYERIVCLSLANGREFWRSDPIDGRTGNRGTVGTLVAQDKVVLFTSYPAGRRSCR